MANYIPELTKVDPNCFGIAVATVSAGWDSMIKEMGRWSVLKSVYTDASVGAGDPLVQPYFSQLRTAVPYTLEAYPEGDKAWSDAVAAAYNGTDAQQALDSAQKAASAAVK